MASFSWSLIFVNGAEAAAKVSQATTKLHNELHAAGNEIGKEFVNQVQMRLYPGHGYRTGNLRGSYGYTMSGEGYQTIVTLSTDCYYAPYVEYRWGGRIAHVRPAAAAMDKIGDGIFAKHMEAALE